MRNPGSVSIESKRDAKFDRYQRPAKTSQPLQPPRLGDEILRVEHVNRGFNKTQGELLVLDDANLSLREGEIVGCSAVPARASRRCCASSPG